MSTWNTYDTPIGAVHRRRRRRRRCWPPAGPPSSTSCVPLIHPTPAARRPAAGDLGAVGDAIVAYHDGDLAAIDDVPVRQRSGEFLEHAWDVLRTVPAGAPVTYTEYAGRPAVPRRSARPRRPAPATRRRCSCRATACVRTDGTLGGFRWGLDVKRALLAHERG